LAISDSVDFSFSVVIANYNYGSFLRQCIESVLEQDYCPVQIIVVDDGSTDNSREVIESFGASVTGIYKSHSGQISSLNAGLSKANRDLIVLLESDDLLAPGALRAYATAFQQPGVVRCQGYMRLITAEGKPTGLWNPARRPEDENLKDMVLGFGPGSYISTGASGNAWLTSFIKKVTPLPEGAAAPDALLFEAAPLYGKTVTLERHVASYRRHGNSMSDKKSPLTSQNISVIIRAHEDHCAWIVSLAARNLLVADPRLWVRKNWRIATLRYLITRLENTGDPPSLWCHLGTVRGTRSVKARVPLFLLLSAIRFSPTPLALTIAKRMIHLRFMQ
jgi:glycosyltransferase involved in cell wall biosynthesis